MINNNFIRPKLSFRALEGGLLIWLPASDECYLLIILYWAFLMVKKVGYLQPG